MSRLGFQLLLAGSLFASNHASFAVLLTIDFEELPLGSEDFYNGSDLAGGFTSFGAQFNNLYTELGGGCCWNGWSYSRTTDTQTPGPSNQYSAFPGSGAESSLQYGVAFSGLDAGGGIIPEITLPTDAEPTSVKVTNTTYAALSMQLGDGFAKKFGGASGSDPDWFLLKVEGLDVANTVVGEVPFYLADYHFADPNEDYILDQWTDLDLTPLSGLGVRKLTFRLSSSDEGFFGMNTPAYVAIDNLVLDVTATPGDFDLNGTVDHLDLMVWEQHYGTALGAGVTTGDADGDGDVDGVDLLAWQLNVSAPQPLSVAVPEPSAALMILSWSIFFCYSRQNFNFLMTPCRRKEKLVFRVLSIVVLQLAGFVSLATAGPFDSHLTSGVAPASIVAWAHAVEDYSPTSEVVHFDQFGGGPHDDPTRGLGPANGATVSLGDLDVAAISGGTSPGAITVGFQATIIDGPGADFAVFENASTFFSDPDFVFGELAFVEVSSNSSDFARFPATSLNIEPDTNTPDPNHDQLDAVFGRNFAGINTTNVDNLAGAHPTLTGTPFDLSDLATHTLVTQGTVDLNGIRYVRFVDIPGEGSFTDSLGNPILDAWKTVESGGFDLDAVGAINAVPEPTSLILTSLALLGTFARTQRDEVTPGKMSLLEIV